MFIAALFIIAKIRKQPKCPSIDDCIKKMWCMYTMEYYSVINLQGTTSGGDEAKNQLNNLEPKEEKISPSEQQEEKRIKKRRIG